MQMNGFELRKAVLNEEIDYVQLKSLLHYEQPRAKIRRFLQDGTLIRVKKGLYVFGAKVAEHPYSKETLANLIYGPSAISLEYALGFYGMIPERVQTLTSITPLRNKNFYTPVGHFSYRYLAHSKYSVGITQYTIDKTHTVFMAAPEKALADFLVLTKPQIKLNNIFELKDYLLNDLRINEEKLHQLEPDLLYDISLCYDKKSCHLLYQYISKIAG
jgi:predicted transcriptional regulator of viral defense system